MASSIKPPKITGPTIRPRIPVSDEDRKAAMAGMGGERTKSAGVAPAVDAPAVLAPEPAAPAAASPSPASAALLAEVAATPTNEPAAVVAAEPVAAAMSTAPTVEAEPLATAARVAEPLAPVTAVTADKPVALPAAAAAATAGRRGRKPRPAEAEPLDTEHSVRIAESTWNEIRLNLVLLPKGAENPANIKKYLELAHKHYEAHLRKQGKLPAK